MILKRPVFSFDSVGPARIANWLGARRECRNVQLRVHALDGINAGSS